ncbi:sporulation protein YpjB [Cohnella sp.]|uniref:sporulation protein YpjB n=1 Tax=Cohnella sp. TaxID=1883426 RepID=UPI003704190F
MFSFRSICLGAVVALGLLTAGNAAASRESAPQSPAASVPGQAYDNFLASAERLYDSVNKGQLEMSLKQLADIESQLRGLPMKEIASAEGVRALAHDVAEMKRVAVAVMPDEAKWKRGAASLRLAADALAHPDKPIWHRYRSVLQEDIGKLAAELDKTAGKQPAAAAVHIAYEQLAQHYSLIRTAALLRAEPSKIERADAVLRYASRIYEADSPKPELVAGTLPPIREAFRELFPQGGAASETIVPPLGAVPPSWGWSAMMGTFIVTILTWAGWRKYKYEEAFGGSPSALRREERQDAAEKLIGRWRRKK